MKRQLIVLLGFVCSNLAIAQNETDVLRYSFLNYSGTSRFVGTGGAIGALGADLTVISINPAGMGKYSRGDFGFTTNLTSNKVDALYNGSAASDNRVNFNISNIGGVFSVPVTNGSQWRRFQFGYTYNRTNDFHSNTFITGKHDNSQLDVFADYAQGIDPTNLNSGPEAFDAGLAYDAYLMSFDSASGNYRPWYGTTDITQTKSIERRGAQYSSDILFSGNYQDKILIGGSLGFPSIRYKERSNYTETFGSDTTVYDTKEYTYSKRLETRGSGFNMKLGLIIVPTSAVRIGLAVHSPTWYSMSDRYSASISSQFEDGSFNQSDIQSPEGFYEYALTTPARFIGDIGLVIGKRGFISAEYEYVNYAGAKLRNGVNSTDNYSFGAENTAVKENYQNASNIRLGGEFRVTNHWSVRGGYALYGSPIKSDVVDFDASRTNYSAGFGYKDRDFSLDFAYSLSKNTNDYYLYDPSITNAVKIDNTLSSFMVTAGFRF
jgi:hypothetical protein